jgi:predicted RecA/RadA family phage recombinase
MNNYIQPGNILTLTAPYAVDSGEGAKVGAIFGVATADILISVEGEFHTTGVFDLAKTSAQAWAVGDRIYWDDSNKRCDTDSRVGFFLGGAPAAAANPTSTGYVRLNGGSAPENTEGAQAAVADLTDSTGDSGTHDDTLADGVTVGVALTDNTAGTADTTLQALADGTTYATDVAAIRNNFADLAGRSNTLRTDLLVHNQNISDLGQKVNEILATLRTAGIIAT